ncbi:MAG: hypothetical protein Kow00102_14170 [Spirochaetota bacterium]|nr:hypothetical protein [Spirochaetota bacterium]
MKSIEYFTAIVIADFIQDLLEGDYETAAITFNTFCKYYHFVTRKQKRTSKKLGRFVSKSILGEKKI